MTGYESDCARHDLGGPPGENQLKDVPNELLAAEKCVREGLQNGFEPWNAS